MDQTRDYVKIHSASYIRRLLHAHLWETPSPNNPSPYWPFKPISLSILSKLYAAEGPLENTKEHADLQKKMGFSYRTLLGELLYAYVTTHCNIGYWVVMLSKFAHHPAEIHYRPQLKRVAKYLRATIDWGICLIARTCGIAKLLVLMPKY